MPVRKRRKSRPTRRSRGLGSRVLLLLSLPVLICCLCLLPFTLLAPDRDTEPTAVRVTAAPTVAPGDDGGADLPTPEQSAQAPAVPPPSIPQAPGVEAALVTTVVDGDTIEVTMNGQSYRVRYIGIDTPEYNDACGDEATAANAALVGGQTVRMIKDVSETDRYGRLLRYVYVGDLFVNAELVRQGWAAPVRYEPDTSEAAFLEAQAVGAPRHICVVAAPTDPPPPPAAPPPAGQGGANCDPSYPTVCIPPSPPDLDCGDIPYRRFQVLPPDPHRFDGDHDGVGCES